LAMAASICIFARRSQTDTLSGLKFPNRKELELAYIA
jgi:hypothetical protein